MQWSDKAMCDLFNNTLAVPEYQRPYIWNEDNIDDFFSDLVNFAASDESYYLFGQIIVHRDGKTLNIVDGQQRITTSTIFLCAVRDIIESRGYSVKALINRLHNAIGFEEYGYHLTSGAENREFFINYVQNGNHIYHEQHKSDRIIKAAYTSLKSKIEEYIGDDDESITKLKLLADKFLDDFHVSYVETDSISQAFTVFETLNARGTPLEVSDLLKNHFFSMLDSSHEYIKDNWMTMVQKTSFKKGSPAQFIKYYWNSCRPFVREKDLFKKICELGRDDTYSFLTDMFNSADVYKTVLQPESGNPRGFDKDTIRSLSILNKFGASSFCPVIIALCNTGNGCSLGKIVNALETMILRNQVIGKKTANKNEILFSNWAYDIYTEKKNPHEILEEIVQRTNSDEDVSISFKKFSPKEQIGKLILIELYNQEHTEIKISDNGQEVHLEHILPKKGDKWDIAPDTRKEYDGRLGNMTLLDGQKNKQIGNNVFDEKKKVYLESKIEDTKNIGMLSSWGPEQIDERQDELLSKVIKRWPRPEIAGFEITSLESYL